MASEIRVNKIENRSGLGTVTFADTGVDLAGIVTATTFSGSGASLTSLPAAQVTGTLPAISGANLTNLAAANLTGTIADARFPATLPAASAANLTSIPAANVTGTLPALTAANLTNIPAANLVGVCTSGLTKTGGFGKLLQVVTVSDSVRETTGSVSLSSANTYYDTPFTVTITPSSTSSKILLMGHVMGESGIGDLYLMWRITRAISGGSTTNIQAPAASSRALGISVFPSGFYNAESASTPTVVNFAGLVDSPSTTSAITYTFQVNSTQNASQTFYYNRTVNDTDAIDFERGLSWITAMEVTA